MLNEHLKSRNTIMYEILSIVIINHFNIIYPVKKVNIPTIGHIFKEPIAYWS